MNSEQQKIQERLDEVIQRLRLEPRHPGTLWLSDKLGWAEDSIEMAHLLRAWEGSVDAAIMLAEKLMPNVAWTIHTDGHKLPRAVGCNIFYTAFPDNFYAARASAAMLGALLVGLKQRLIEAAETDPAKRKSVKSSP